MCVCVFKEKPDQNILIEKNWKHHLNLNPTSRRLLDMWCVAKLYWTRVERFCFIASATVIVSGLDQSGTRWAVRAANMRPTARRNASEPGWLAVEPSEKYWVWNYRNIWASVKILYISVQVVAIIGYRFLGGISLYSVSCTSLTRPPAILKWSSTILILTHIQSYTVYCWKWLEMWKSWEINIPFSGRKSSGKRNKTDNYIGRLELARGGARPRTVINTPAEGMYSKRSPIMVPTGKRILDMGKKLRIKMAIPTIGSSLRLWARPNDNVIRAKKPR